MPTDESAAAPFTDGRWLLSHNGRVDRAVLPAYVEAESVCDSAVLAAHVFAQRRTGPDQLAKIVTEVAALDPSARLSLLLTDGTRILATSWGDPLSYLVEPDGVARRERALRRRPALGRRTRPTTCWRRRPTGSP